MLPEIPTRRVLGIQIRGQEPSDAANAHPTSSAGSRMKRTADGDDI